MERYEAYKDSGVEWIGEIPAGWTIAPLKSLCTIAGGATPSKVRVEYWDGDIPWVSSQEVKSSHLYDTSLHITKDALDSCSTDIYPAGTIVVVVRSGILKHTLPAAMLDVPMSINQDVKALRFASDITAEFLLHYVAGLNDTLLKYLSKEGATVDNLDVYLFSRCPVPLPPLGVQQAIVAYLDAKTAEVDALVADCEREVGLLREYRKAVISEAVSKGLDPDAPMKDSGVEWIGEIPEGWNIVPFKAIGRVSANLQHPTDYPNLPQVSPDRIEKDSGRLLPCISVAEVGVESDNHLFHAGDILYSKVRPALNKVTVAPFDGMCSADMYPIESSQNKRWLVFYMLSTAFMEQVIVSTDRVKMPKINKEELGAFKVVLPTVDAQSEIVAHLDAKTAEIDSLIEAKQSMADKLREYRRSLISEAVTGKFRVGAA